MRRLFIRFLFGISCIGIYIQLITIADDITSDEEISQYEEFCKNSIETKGLLNEEHQEVKLSKIKLYIYTYNFKVEDSVFNIELSTYSDDPKTTKTLWYNANNPKENSFKNPCEELNKLKGKTKFGNKTFFKISGVIIGLIGLGIAWGAIKGMIGLGLRKLFKK